MNDFLFWVACIVVAVFFGWIFFMALQMPFFG